MKKLITLIGVFAFLLTSCNSITGVKEVKVGDTASIEVPKLLIESKDLNDDAIVQMANGLQELYVIVIDESKQEFNDLIKEGGDEFEDEYTPNLNGYAKVATSSIESSIELISKEELKPVVTNGLSTYVATFEGKINGLDVYYKLSCVEGKERYYQVLTWTLSSKKDKHLEAMNAMINSFKEI